MDILAVDIGSNTIKCLLANRTNSRVNKLFECTLNSRISSLQNDGLVENASILIAEAIKIFKADASAFSSDFRVIAVATSALREAQNKDEIVADVFKLCNCQIKILDCFDEARLSYSGAMSDPLIDSEAPNAYFDLGGGSLEIVFGKNTNADSFFSMPIGAVNLTRKFLANPKLCVKPGDFSKIENFTKESLKSTLPNTMPYYEKLVGAGGAVVAARLAKKALALAGDENIITLEQLRFISQKICAATSVERAQNYAVSAGRTDIVPAAFATICALMQKLGAQEIVHTFNNLRYGIILEAD